MKEPYEILWTAHALKALRAHDDRMRRRILNAVADLSQDPFAKAQRMAGVPTHRVRVGDYRVVVQIADEGRTILVLDVAHRRSVYR